MKVFNYIGFFFLSLFACSAFAYKQKVHMALTDYAALQSVLANPKIWQEWTVDNEKTFPHPFTETDFHKDSSFQKNLTYKDLLKFGVDAEDTHIGADVTKEPFWSRAFSHFYNPQVNKKLGLPYTNYTNPEWALETAFGGGVSIPSQDYSYADAQNYFFGAFAARYQSERDLNMGKMFQTLGHVVHMVQDMAQPEHTRLDKHCDATGCKAAYLLVGDDTSLFEEYTNELLDCGGALATSPVAASDQNADCPKLRSWDNKPFTTKKVFLGGYPVPAFSSPQDYWHTADLKGMADFSSRNFITTDTPYELAPCETSPCATPLGQRLIPKNAELPFPSGDPTTTTVSSYFIKDLLPADKLGKLSSYKDFKMNFINLRTTDNFTGAAVDIPRMASFSVFSERLSLRRTHPEKGGAIILPPVFSINYFNLEQWSKELLPRAVGYSTGVLNHFFRYRIKVTEEKVEGTGKRSRWKVTNLSNYEFSGCIKFYYDAGASDRREVSSSCSRNVVIRAGATETFDPLVVSESERPSTTFYAVAVQPTGNPNSPYAAVAATSFYNENTVGKEIEVPCKKIYSKRTGNTHHLETMEVGNKARQLVFYFGFGGVNITHNVKLKYSNGAVFWSVSPPPVNYARSTYHIVDYDPARFPDHVIKLEITHSVYPWPYVNDNINYNLYCSRDEAGDLSRWDEI